jgi:phospholipase C
MADRVNHVIVLILENRSFDHMLGDLQQVYPNLSGVNRIKPGTNIYNGISYPQDRGASRFVTNDPKHEYEHVLKQISANNGGFVRDFAEAHPDATHDDWQEVMRFHESGSLPAIHTLAKNFLICDHWYSSVPGPTWPNRLFAMSGTSLGRVSMPEGLFNWNLHWYSQPTIFDRLNEKNKTWKVYFGDFALSLLLVHQWEPRNVMNFHHMTEFYRDAASVKVDEFPAFSFIEPSYMPPGANDGHPPHDIVASETLVANVYNAIRANEALWKESLLVVLCDEHGGFYDHESAVAMVAPDSHQEDGFQFNLSGLRVPAILISPWVKAGVLSTQFDHTSLLKYLIDKWQLGPLGNRAANASTFASSLEEELRADTPARIYVPVQMAASTPRAPEVLSRSQSAMIALSHALESMAGEDPNTVAARSKHILSSAQSHVDIAMDRLESFIEKLTSKFRIEQKAGK